MQGSSATASRRIATDERKGEWLAFLHSLNPLGMDLQLVAYFIDKDQPVNTNASQTTLRIGSLEGHMKNIASRPESMLGSDQARTSVVMLSLFNWVWKVDGSAGASYRGNMRELIEKLQDEFVPALKVDKWADFSRAADGTGQKLGHCFREFFFPE
ncbi:hypothetical protein QFC21_007077 [Naganishia friedmannii]|uniref:Uncharacterized protein n=1 Tax=Naganishia friedmannii TaxID=89922 RepID=A0ACC2UXU1_9TREE|nr:hypothetical protein QFC21_007077 [Naganishia friedmannii]